MKVLDLGAGGGYGNTLAIDLEPELQYTCLGVDSKSIKVRKINYPNLNFVNGSFP